jgi:CRP-like cAMP-binding protein
MDESTYLRASNVEARRHFDPMAMVNPKVKERLLAIGDPVFFEAGAVLLSEDAPGRTLYLLQSGAVETFIGLSGGATRRLSVVTAPTLIGELAFIDDQPRSATVRALRQTTGRRIDYDTFQELGVRDPPLAHALTLLIANSLAHRLRRVTLMLGGRAP